MRPTFLQCALLTILAFTSVITIKSAITPDDPPTATIERTPLRTIYKRLNQSTGESSTHEFPTLESIKLDPTHTCTGVACQSIMRHRYNYTVHICNNFAVGGARMCAVMDLSLAGSLPGIDIKLLMERPDGQADFWAGDIFELFEMLDDDTFPLLPVYQPFISYLKQMREVERDEL